MNKRRHRKHNLIPLLPKGENGRVEDEGDAREG